jgi:hypothetical protein
VAKPKKKKHTAPALRPEDEAALRAFWDSPVGRDLQNRGKQLHEIFESAKSSNKPKFKGDLIAAARKAGFLPSPPQSKRHRVAPRQTAKAAKSNKGGRPPNDWTAEQAWLAKWLKNYLADGNKLPSQDALTATLKDEYFVGREHEHSERTIKDKIVRPVWRAMKRHET